MVEGKNNKDSNNDAGDGVQNGGHADDTVAKPLPKKKKKPIAAANRKKKKAPITPKKKKKKIPPLKNINNDGTKPISTPQPGELVGSDDGRESLHEEEKTMEVANDDTEDERQSLEKDEEKGSLPREDSHAADNVAKPTVEDFDLEMARRVARQIYKEDEVRNEKDDASDQVGTPKESVEQVVTREDVEEGAWSTPATDPQTEEQMLERAIRKIVLQEYQQQQQQQPGQESQNAATNTSNQNGTPPLSELQPQQQPQQQEQESNVHKTCSNSFLGCCCDIRRSIIVLNSINVAVAFFVCLLFTVVFDPQIQERIEEEGITNIRNTEAFGIDYKFDYGNSGNADDYSPTVLKLTAGFTVGICMFIIGVISGVYVGPEGTDCSLYLSIIMVIWYNILLMTFLVKDFDFFFLSWCIICIYPHIVHLVQIKKHGNTLRQRPSYCCNCGGCKR